MTLTLLTTSARLPDAKKPEEGRMTDWGQRTYMRIVQYVPNELRGERVNVAIVLQNPSQGYAGMRVRPFMDKLVEALWPAIDAALIRTMVREIEELLKPLNRNTRKESKLFTAEAPDERSLPSYLDRFNQTYGSLRFSEPKPVRVNEGESFREKLNQLFDLYIKIDDDKQKKQSITKEVLQFQIGKELERRGTVYQSHLVIKGEFFENKFDLARIRIDGIGSLAHIISFDLKNIDPAVTQSLRLLKSLDDLKEADPNLLEKYEFGVFLQAPVHFRQHSSDYSDALKAFRSKFRVFQNVGDEPEISRATEGLVNSLANKEGFSAVS
ncbi:DUF3037 domain-containing protein [Deinococcus gobiensis]|nr:DUF3037 domain-containing protein [Deinococcus gobiensis]